MARHTACDRVDGVGDFDTMVLEQGAKVSELTLGLGLGQTEARHEDDLLCVDELDGQIVGSDVTSGGGYIEVNDVTEGLWSFVEQEAPEGYALDPTPHSVYVSVTDGDRQYTVTAEDEELPGIKVIKTSATDGTPIENAVIQVTDTGNPDNIIEELTTDNSGEPPPPSLPALFVFF